MAKFTYVRTNRRMQGRGVRGLQVEKYVALMRPTQSAIKRTADHIARLATAQLRAHRDTGAARIERSSGHVDEWVTLVDPAAMSIEFGRSESRRQRPDGSWYTVGAMEPIAPMRIAIAGLPRRAGGRFGRVR